MASFNPASRLFGASPPCPTVPTHSPAFSDEISLAYRAIGEHSLDEHRHHPGLSAPPSHPSRKRPSSPPPPPHNPNPSSTSEPSSNAESRAVRSGGAAPTSSSHVSLPPYLQSTLPLDVLSLLEPPFLTLSRDLPRATPAPEFDWSVFDRAWTWTRGRGTPSPSPSGSGSNTPLPLLPSIDTDAPTKEWQRQVLVEETADLAQKRAPSLSSLRASSPAPSDVSNDSCASNESSETIRSSISGEEYTTICDLEVVRRPNKRRRKVMGVGEDEVVGKMRGEGRKEEPVEDVDLWMRIFDTMQH